MIGGQGAASYTRILRPSGASMGEETLLERITVNPKIFGGKPIIRGRRLAVEHVLGMLADTMSARSSTTPLPRLCAADLTVFPSTRIAGPASRWAMSRIGARALAGFASVPRVVAALVAKRVAIRAETICAGLGFSAGWARRKHPGYYYKIWLFRILCG